MTMSQFTIQNNGPFVTVADVARRWLVSDQTVLNECRRGKLSHMRVGRQIRIPLKAVLDAEGQHLPEPEPQTVSLPDVPDEIGDA
jgi:excisionase family DNA binding protein